jgi:hypothetical protein
MLPLCSAGQDDKRNQFYDNTFLEGRECLEAMVAWIQAAASLPTHGMPSESFSMIIDNTLPESEWA